MKYFLTVFSFIILVTPTLVLAQFKPLVGIPGVSNPENFDQYLQAIYATAIGLAALLAVIKIVIAGVKWMVTDIVTSKSDAKKDIEGAVFGLVLILGAVLILYIINPNIGKVDLSFAPPPEQAVPAGVILIAEVEACKSDSTCTFDRIVCPTSRVPIEGSEIYGTNRQVMEVKSDCAPAVTACLGKSTVSNTDDNGEPTEISCLLYTEP